MPFIEAFMEMYNIIAAVIIIFLCGLVLLKTHKLDTDLLKARLFLNNAIIQQTWIYISIAGASFALNALIKFAGRFTAIGKVLNIYYVEELTQIIFLIVFIVTMFSWFSFIRYVSSIQSDSSQARKNWRL
jgi:hypothetical protein